MEGARAPGRPRTSSPLRGALVSFRSNMGLHCSDMLRRFVRYLRVSAQAWRRPCAVRRGGSENGLGRCQWLIDHVSCDAWVRSWLAI